MLGKVFPIPPTVMAEQQAFPGLEGAHRLLHSAATGLESAFLQPPSSFAQPLKAALAGLLALSVKRWGWGGGWGGVGWGGGGAGVGVGSLQLA